MSLIFAVVFSATGLTSLILTPKTANAVVENATSVPVGGFSLTMDYLKNFKLDRLATMIAKQLLHQMTISVVTWINSGFNGSPAFLTNPQAFFLDSADQVTGEFLASGGLSSLCSPFSLNVRLSLALSQTSLMSQRYRCTLGGIVANANGTINGFVSGDFSQGGWPAFISMTTEPQNNPYGAFLYAQSDLNARISARHNAITADLQLGKGFMSWQSCKDVTSIMEGGGQDMGDVSDTAGGSTVKKVIDPKTKAVTYQSCEVSTPGSVIAGTLQKNLDVPVVELELANSINAVVDALISQMLSQMLSGGLGGLSSATGGRASFTNNLQLEQTKIYQEEIDNAQLQTSASLGQILGSVDEYRNTYKQAASAVNASKTRLQTARACFSNKLAASDASSNPIEKLNPIQIANGRNAMSSIESYISMNIDPLLASLSSKQAGAERDISRINGLQDLNSTHLYSSNDIQAQSIAYQNAIQSAAEIDLQVQEKIQIAKQDVANTTNKVAEFNTAADQYQRDCEMFTYTSGSWQGI